MACLSVSSQTPYPAKTGKVTSFSATTTLAYAPVAIWEQVYLQAVKVDSKLNDLKFL